MLNLLLYIFISAYTAYGYSLDTKKPELQYELKTTSATAGYVQVVVRASHFQDKEVLSFRINQDNMERFIARYEYADKKTRAKVSVKKNILTVHAKGSTKLTIRYKVKIQNYEKKFSGKTVLPNLAVDEALIFFGFNTFIIPVIHGGINITPNLYLNLKFPKFWKTVSSWGLNSEVVKIMSVKSLSEGVILAGKVQLERLKVKNKSYYVLFLGDWEGTKKRLLSLYKTIASKQIRIWNFLPADYMIVAFLKDKAVDTGKGLQYLNTIVYVLPSEIDLRDIEFLKFLAHEHFHLWNGAYIKPNDKDLNSVKWFHEGLTDYFALMTIISEGIVDERAFLKYFTSKYLEYEDKFSKGGMGKPENEMLNGFFLAYAIDMEIRRASKGRKNLTDVLRNLSVKNAFWDKGYTNIDLKAEFARAANWDVDDFFDKHIYTSGKLNLQSYLNYLGLSVFTKDTDNYEQGFETRTSRGSSRVSKIKAGSAAERSGLRLNDIVLEIQKPSKPKEDLKLKVKRGRRTMKLVFSPWIPSSEVTLVHSQNLKSKFYSKWVGF